MAPIEPAMPRDDFPESDREGVPVVPLDRAIPVPTILRSPNSVATETGPAMAAILERLAAAGGPNGFDDPAH